MMALLSPEKIEDLRTDVSAYYRVLKAQLDKVADYDGLKDNLMFDMVLVDTSETLTPATMDKNKFYVQVVQDNNQAILVSYLELPSNRKKTTRYTAGTLNITKFAVPFDIHAIKARQEFRSPTTVRDLFAWLSVDFKELTETFQGKLNDGTASDEDLEQYKQDCHTLLNDKTVVIEMQIFRRYVATYMAPTTKPEDGKRPREGGLDVTVIRAWKALVDFVDWVIQGFPKIHKPRASMFRPATKTERMVADFLEKTAVLGGAAEEMTNREESNLFLPTAPTAPLLPEAKAVVMGQTVYNSDGLKVKQ